MDLASAEAEIRHVFGDTPITEASIGAAPPDILVKLSGLSQFKVKLQENFQCVCTVSMSHLILNKNLNNNQNPFK